MADPFFDLDLRWTQCKTENGKMQRGGIHEQISDSGKGRKVGTNGRRGGFSKLLCTFFLW